MADVTLTRFYFGDKCTLGRLVFNGPEDELFRCWTCENPYLDNKVNVSSIPDGSYTMGRVDSPRFGKDCWSVLNVPGRSHILLHAGNKAKDTRGCILPGSGLLADGVSQSKKALETFAVQAKTSEELGLVIQSGIIKELSQ